MICNIGFYWSRKVIFDACKNAMIILHSSETPGPDLFLGKYYGKFVTSWEPPWTDAHTLMHGAISRKNLSNIDDVSELNNYFNTVLQFDPYPNPSCYKEYCTFAELRTHHLWEPKKYVNKPLSWINSTLSSFSNRTRLLPIQSFSFLSWMIFKAVCLFSS